MYERMADKEHQPEIHKIRQYIGETSCKFLQEFENQLQAKYDLNRELRYPFGKSYGWGFKYSHKSKHLCYLFFEKEAVTVTLQIGDREVDSLNRILQTLSETTVSLWENRYPCGENGGWIHLRILSKNDLTDVIKLIEVKKKPPKR